MFTSYAYTLTRSRSQSRTCPGSRGLPLQRSNFYRGIESRRHAAHRRLQSVAVPDLKCGIVALSRRALGTIAQGKRSRKHLDRACVRWRRPVRGTSRQLVVDPTHIVLDGHSHGQRQIRRTNARTRHQRNMCAHTVCCAPRARRRSALRALRGGSGTLPSCDDALPAAPGCICNQACYCCTHNSNDDGHPPESLPEAHKARQDVFRDEPVEAGWHTERNSAGANAQHAGERRT